LSLTLIWCTCLVSHILMPLTIESRCPQLLGSDLDWASSLLYWSVSLNVSHLPFHRHISPIPTPP
jgi:hypothetical protein